MRRFVVNPETGCGSGTREPVDAYPCQDLVVRPGIGVCPVVQLFEEPSEEAYRRVAETVAEGLRFCGLFDTVAGAFFEEPVCAGEAGVVASGVGG